MAEVNGDEGSTKSGRVVGKKRSLLTSDIDILEEWVDTAYQPLPLEEIAVIEYNERFRRMFGLLYSARKLPERSLRGIRLAKACIGLNKAHVTAWTYRYECAQAVGTVWKEELASIGKVLLKSPKNYQAWNYRRHCVANSDRNFRDEASFVDITLANDAKNYHAWAHRQWALKQSINTKNEYGLDTADELIMMDILISEDVRNNSAWNHRWWLVANCDTPMKDKQINYALKLIDKAPRNEAAWNFIAAVIHSDADVNIQEAIDVAKKCLENDSENLTVRKFLACTAFRNAPKDALNECNQLAEIDKVRRKYWEHRAQQWRTMLKQEEK